jgi:hypothetical protein
LACHCGWRVVEQLDLSRFATEVRAVEGVAGRPSHSPQVLVAVWIYAFSKGLLTLERVAVDGTKIRADAGKKSFTKRDRIETHLALAREHLDELERQENDEHATQRKRRHGGVRPASASSASTKRWPRSSGCAPPRKTTKTRSRRRRRAIPRRLSCGCMMAAWPRPTTCKSPSMGCTG